MFFLKHQKLQVEEDCGRCCRRKGEVGWFFFEDVVWSSMKVGSLDIVAVLE